MNAKSKKLSAAVITGVFCMIIFAGLAVFFIRLDEAPFLIRFLYGTVFAGLCFGMSCVLSERIEEIRKGEDDDLDNY